MHFMFLLIFLTAPVCLASEVPPLTRQELMQDRGIELGGTLYFALVDGVFLDRDKAIWGPGYSPEESRVRAFSSNEWFATDSDLPKNISYPRRLRDVTPFVETEEKLEMNMNRIFRKVENRRRTVSDFVDAIQSDSSDREMALEGFKNALEQMGANDSTMIWFGEFADRMRELSSKSVHRDDLIEILIRNITEYAKGLYLKIGNGDQAWPFTRVVCPPPQTPGEVTLWYGHGLRTHALRRDLLGIVSRTRARCEESLKAKGK